MCKAVPCFNEPALWINWSGEDTVVVVMALCMVSHRGEGEQKRATGKRAAQRKRAVRGPEPASVFRTVRVD